MRWMRPGVHPLMLAIGSERYVPYESARFPRELLTQANAILGQGQMSLAKYLWIVDRRDDPDLEIHDVAGVLAARVAARGLAHATCISRPARRSTLWTIPVRR